MDLTGTSLGVRRTPFTAAASSQQRAEQELMRVLNSADEYTTREQWRKAVRASVIELRMARGRYHREAKAFYAERAAFRADCARIAAELDSLKHAAE